ncbi:Myzus persicae-induced lipase 1 [Actinidia rufa]|uniref:Myzus persicae-induced lipase 1 n=1 Tax=Actinidia rufa TaxID=165716 RepID=A0A7J0GJZ4_9ERIC|nr:Myzus persicae-induced lipase 1 [Actinidia rufa]
MPESILNVGRRSLGERPVKILRPTLARPFATLQPSSYAAVYTLAQRPSKSCPSQPGTNKTTKYGLQFSISIVLVFLFCGSAVGTRTTFFLTTVMAAVAPSADDGICQSMVETQNYTCEEHSDAITWLLNPLDQCLALLLADNGFDVWLASTRGTKYSLGHTSLSPEDSDYWNWSWDELVAYDLPATFQYVHDQTGQKLHYVGHSLGTLIALASFSKGQLINMLTSVALLSPIAHLGQMTSPLARTAAENYIAEDLYKLGLHEFNPRGAAVIKLLKTICEKPGVDCTNLLTSFTVIRQGTITMFDYKDEDENQKHYGQPTPPAYNMASIPNDLPLFLSYGGADALSDVNDVQLLLEDLKDHEGDKLVVQYTVNYAHADYVMADNAKQVVYDSLMDFFKLQ